MHLIYNHFRSPLEQTVQDVVRLPIADEDDSAEHDTELGDYIYEPEAAIIYAGLLPATSRSPCSAPCSRAAPVNRARA